MHQDEHLHFSKKTKLLDPKASWESKKPRNAKPRMIIEKKANEQPKEHEVHAKRRNLIGLISEFMARSLRNFLPLDKSSFLLRENLIKKGNGEGQSSIQNRR